jgi:hypothetical protein
MKAKKTKQPKNTLDQTARKALATIYKKTLDATIETLLRDMSLIVRRDRLTEPENAKDKPAYFTELLQINNRIDNGNTADIINDCIAFYVGYCGQKLCDNANNGEKMGIKTGVGKWEIDKDGNKIMIDCDIYTACLRHVRNYILSQRKQTMSTIYVEYDENIIDRTPTANDICTEKVCENTTRYGKTHTTAKYIRIPQKWDIDTICELLTIDDIINKANLTKPEKDILTARLRGYGYRQIGQVLSMTCGNVQTYLLRIREKVAQMGIDYTAYKTAQAEIKQRKQAEYESNPMWKANRLIKQTKKPFAIC